MALYTSVGIWVEMGRLGRLRQPIFLILTGSPLTLITYERDDRSEPS